MMGWKSFLTEQEHIDQCRGGGEEGNKREEENTYPFPSEKKSAVSFHRLLASQSVRGMWSRSLHMLSHHVNSWQQVIRDKTILEMAHNRVLVMAALFSFAFLVIALRLCDVMLWRSLRESKEDSSGRTFPSPIARRMDIFDRHGEILATHLVTASLYANPKVILNPKEAAEKLCHILPSLSYKSLLAKLKNPEKGFVWIARHIPPKLHHAINLLGIPGVYFQKDYRRIYPHGSLVSHILGGCNIDDGGLGGIEKFLDDHQKIDPSLSTQPLFLSLDLRVQHSVRDELMGAIEEFQAEGGNAIVMKVETGEIMAMVSYPDYDPNFPQTMTVDSGFNKNTLGIYEPGSVFKIFNTATALESGTATLSTIYDASAPIRVGSKKITDFKGKNRPLHVWEIFIYSSNIGSAKMALAFGSAVQEKYFKKLGLLSPPSLEVPEVGAPLIPKSWSSVTTMTLAYGYGIAVSPLMVLEAVRTVVMGVRGAPPTLIRVMNPPNPSEKKRVFSEKTAHQIRDLMRMVVTEGTAKKADVKGYDVFGKTGTAHRNQGRSGYNNSRRTVFVGGFPKSNPQYMLIVFLDDPKPTKKTYGYATGGWTTAPLAGRIIDRIAPLLGVFPQESSASEDLLSSPTIGVENPQGND